MFLFFTLTSYVYKNLYVNCHEKTTIKTDDDTTKKVVKIRTGLSLIYLGLLSILYFLLTWYVLITLLIFVSLMGIFVAHKLEPSILDVLKKYDTHPLMKRFWQYYSVIVNIMLKIMSPLHKIIENQIIKKKDKVYDYFFGSITKKRDINPLKFLTSDNLLEDMTKIEEFFKQQEMTSNNK